MSVHRNGHEAIASDVESSYYAGPEDKATSTALQWRILNVIHGTVQKPTAAERAEPSLWVSLLHVSARLWVNDLVAFFAPVQPWGRHCVSLQPRGLHRTMA